MEKINGKISWDLHGQLTRAAAKLRVINKKAYDYGTGEPINTFDIQIIDAVGRNYGRNITELAEWFSVTKGAISQAAGRLSQAGYINKDRHPVYGKEVVLTLTGKGEIALAGFENVRGRIYQDFLSELELVPGEKLLEMKDFLVKINRLLEQSMVAAKKISFDKA
jgi:DNA-binding MarR family transcriptional regulator